MVTGAWIDWREKDETTLHNDDGLFRFIYCDESELQKDNIIITNKNDVISISYNDFEPLSSVSIKNWKGTSIHNSYVLKDCQTWKSIHKVYKGIFKTEAKVTEQLLEEKQEAERKYNV